MILGIARGFLACTRQARGHVYDDDLIAFVSVNFMMVALALKDKVETTSEIARQTFVLIAAYPV